MEVLLLDHANLDETERERIQEIIKDSDTHTLKHVYGAVTVDEYSIEDKKSKYASK